jgi:sodium transport system permease protein
MRFPIIQAIYHKEILDMFRDRRTMISMLVIPLLVFPLVVTLMMRFASRMEENAEADARKLGIAVQVTTPSVREALEKIGFPLKENADLRGAVEKKEAAAGVEERGGEIEILADNSNPTSSAAADKIRVALAELKDQRVRESLRAQGISESVLSPFTVKRTNIAGDRKMAGSAWGSILGYILLLLMFTGGMYPVIDMTAGEKERKTIEAFLAAPVERSEIVLGKTMAAMTAIFLTAMLTLGSMVYSLRNNGISAKSAEVRRMMGTIPLDGRTIAMIVAMLIPVAIFAASVMFAIALFARSFKEGQSYLTPLALLVVFPALLGGLPGLQLTPAMCLIPIFNASLVIRGILLGELSTLNMAIAFGANLVYAGIAFFIAARQFEKESVLFRS